MKCYICEGNFGEEAGWFLCDTCRKRFNLEKSIADAIESGELIVVRDEVGIYFRPRKN